MRFRSWLPALFAAVLAFFGFGPEPAGAAQPAAPERDLIGEHVDRVGKALREIRINNRANASVIPPFHKVKGKTRAFMRPGYAGHR
ncbi:MAG: hypothetical protein ACJ8AK_03115 [Gemmatimonadaceae bacterium]